MKHRLNESQTEYELIEPALRKAGWGEVEGSHIQKQHPITDGRLIGNGKRGKILKADYVLVYKNRFLAIIEAKAKDKYHTEGLAQAKQYASMLELRYTYSTNGQKIYQVDMSNATEGLVDGYPTPDELWDMTFGKPKLNNKIDWQAEFNSIPYENFLGKYQPRYYQRNAIENVLEAVANGKDRILLTMATGTGKTAVAFHICWKLFQARWNIQRVSKRLPRILFLADRNGLANQAFNAFNAFDDDALVRIKPNEIRKKGSVPKNRSIFFTIFQTFMSGEYVETDEEEEYEKKEFYTDYDEDFFDFIIIDECHRGGANDESSWRDILNYFSPAVQLGLTATPKRTINADTYSYFGEPVYTYSLKAGINDGFLTPFRVKQISTTLDEYQWTPGDKIVSGEVDEKKVYKEGEFNRKIEIEDRELARVKIFLNSIRQNDKSLIFCSTQVHAAKIRDMINQESMSKNVEYCVRVTSDDGERGEQYLSDFQNDEKMIPTILTTSKKLSTGIDAPEVKNIVLLREVKSMIEFKQIIGRGTRIYDGKDYFTVFDFVKAHEHFNDPEWDGEPLDPEPKQQRPEEPVCGYCGKNPCGCEGGIIKDPCLVCGNRPCICEKPPREIIKIKLSNNTVRNIQSMEKTTFFDASGKVISSDEFVNNLYGGITELFKNEDELRQVWSLPSTRRQLLIKLEDIGYSRVQLEEITELVNAQNSDLYDVLIYIAFNKDILDRKTRAENVEANLAEYNNNQQEFIKFVLSQYISQGVDELDDSKLSDLVDLKYHAIADAKAKLGDIRTIKDTFTGFQKYLYQSLYS